MDNLIESFVEGSKKPLYKDLNYLKNLRIKLIKTRLNKDGNFDLKNILLKIKLLGFSRIFLECGLNLTTNFLSKNLVNDFNLFISNKNIGKRGSNSFYKNI